MHWRAKGLVISSDLNNIVHLLTTVMIHEAHYQKKISGKGFDSRAEDREDRLFFDAAPLPRPSRLNVALTDMDPLEGVGSTSSHDGRDI